MSEREILKLWEEVVRWEGKIAELAQQARLARERIDELQRQRRKQILGALAEDDPAAKKQLEKLTVEVERAERQLTDLALACEQAGKRLDGLREELTQAERIDQEEQLLKLLQQRESIGHEMARLLEEHLLPLLRQAAGLSDEMTGLAELLGLDCSIRDRVFTNLLGFPSWACEKAFPIKLGGISGVPIEPRTFRPALTPAHSSAARAAITPRSGALSSRSEPPNFPIDVRAALTMSARWPTCYLPEKAGLRCSTA